LDLELAQSEKARCRSARLLYRINITALNTHRQLNWSKPAQNYAKASYKYRRGTIDDCDWLNSALQGYYDHRKGENLIGRSQ
jgi:hypothetical protein